MTQRDRERGALTAEYIGIVMVVVGLVGGLILSGVVDQVADACAVAVCMIFGGDCAIEGGRVPDDGGAPAAEEAPGAVPAANVPAPDGGGGGRYGPRPPIPPPTCEPNPDVPWTEGLHAHNDYENENALQDALDHGATSVEVDVYLDENGNVVVKHLVDDLVRGTLTDLYVNPLNERVQQNGGQVHPGRTEPFQVLLEIKEPREDLDGDGMTEYDEAYQKAIKELEGLPPGTRVVVDYPGANFAGYGEQPPNVYYTITPRQVEDDPATEENERGCANPPPFDPNSPEYDPEYAKNFVILNGGYDNCANGDGEVDDEEQEKLNQFVAEAHAAGYEVRIVEGPDGSEREGATITATSGPAGFGRTSAARAPRRTGGARRWRPAWTTWTRSTSPPAGTSCEAAAEADGVLVSLRPARQLPAQRGSRTLPVDAVLVDPREGLLGDQLEARAAAQAVAMLVDIAGRSTSYLLAHPASHTSNRSHWARVSTAVSSGQVSFRRAGGENQAAAAPGDSPARTKGSPMVRSTAAGAPSVDVRELGSKRVGISWPASARRLAVPTANEPFDRHLAGPSSPGSLAGST